MLIDFSEEVPNVLKAFFPSKVGRAREKRPGTETDFTAFRISKLSSGVVGTMYNTFMK